MNTQLAGRLRGVRMHRLMRQLHLWIGAWGAIAAILFGISGFMQNHRAVLKLPQGDSTEVSKADLAVPESARVSRDALRAWLRDEQHINVENQRGRGGESRGAESRGGASRAGDSPGGKLRAGEARFGDPGGGESREGEPPPAGPRAGESWGGESEAEPRGADAGDGEARAVESRGAVGDQRGGNARGQRRGGLLAGDPRGGEPGSERAGDPTALQRGRWNFNGGNARVVTQVEYVEGARTATVRTNVQSPLAVLARLHKGVGGGVAWILLGDSFALAMIALGISGLVLWSRGRTLRQMIFSIVGVALVVLLAIGGSAIA
jgi:hypothetical protein